MVKIPKIKKNPSSFLTGEEGKISKQALMKVGTIVAVASTLVSDDAAAHVSHNSMLDTAYDAGTVTATHSSAETHGSHGSHGSCGWVSW